MASQAEKRVAELKPLSTWEQDLRFQYTWYKTARESRRFSDSSDPEEINGLNWNIAARISNIVRTLAKEREGKFFFTKQLPKFYIPGEAQERYYVAFVLKGNPEVISKVVDLDPNKEISKINTLDLVENMPPVDVSLWADNFRLTDSIVDGLLLDGLRKFDRVERVKNG